MHSNHVRRRWSLAARTCFAATVAFSCLFVWAVARVTPEIGPAPDSTAASDKAPADGTPLWRFGFVGDTHAGPELTDRIFAGLADHNVEFVLHLGDMVDHGERDEEWSRLIELAKKHHVKLMPVVGNHDKLPEQGDNGRRGFKRYFPEIPGTTYRFEHGGLTFLMLNSEEWFSPWTQQGREVRRELQESQGPTLVCLHRPVFTCSRRDWPRMALRRLWLHGPLSADNDVLAVLAGHNHYYERSRPLDGVTYVVSGGGAKNCYQAGRPDHRTAKLVERRNHYGVAEVYVNRLLVRTIDLEGQPLDEFTLMLSATLPELPSGAPQVAGLRALVR